MNPVRNLMTAAAISLLAAAPANAAPRPVAAGEPTVRYVVRRGDTLYDLGALYLARPGDYRVVQRRNRIADPRRMAVGSRLDIPLRLLRTSVVEARVASFQGEVSVATGGPATPVSKGLVLGEGAVIATGVNAFVRMELPDGSQVVLPSQSRIRIDRLRQVLLTGTVDRAFFLYSGRSEAVVTPMKSPRDGFRIITPLSVSAVRGTVFRVAYDPASRQASTEVTTGTVQVGATLDNLTAVVPSSFGVHASTGEVSPPTPLLPSPEVLRPGRLQDEGEIVFDLTPQPGAVAYRARLAPDAGLLDPVEETLSDQPRLAFQGVRDGEWFVRVTALDAGGLEGMPATYGFTRARHELRLLSPARDAKSRRWQFRWEGQGTGQRAFRFQLWKGEAEAVPLIDEAGLSDPGITVTDLADGEYRWRVRSTLTHEGRSFEKWSGVQQFRIGD